MSEMRLQRFLARAGIASRRACERLIEEGRVSVNGIVVTELGTKVDPESDAVAFDGERVRVAPEHVVIMLNKPCGVTTTMGDPHATSTVAQLVPLDAHPALFPIGRLDKDTSGMLLLTDDGDLGNRLLHPRHHVGKTYIAVVEGTPTSSELARLRTGIELDGRLTLPAECELLSSGRIARVELRIYEGRNRQVRRMLDAIGHPVVRLERVRIGELGIGELASGSWRYLSADEVAQLAAGDAAG